MIESYTQATPLPRTIIFNNSPTRVCPRQLVRHIWRIKSIKRDLEYSRFQNIKMADERNPAERVRRLVQYAGQVEVDNSIAPKKYFRSGVEMERMVRIICQVMGYEMDCVDVCCNNFFYQQSHLGVLCGCFFFIVHHSLCIYFSSKRITLVRLITNNDCFRFSFLIGRQILRNKALQ